MAFPVFGPGIIIVKRTDIPNQTPVNIGYAQELNFSEKATVKSLFGQNQRALVLAKGTIKATGKIKAAEFSSIAINSIFYAEALVTGGVNWQPNEQHVIPAGGGPVTVSTTAGFSEDLGVQYSATGQPLQFTTAALTTGFYSIAAGGVYDFAAGDASAAIGITYSGTVAAGASFSVGAHLIGTTPTFELNYWTSLNSNPFAVKVFNCVASDLTQDFKLEDFMMPAMDFEFGANAAGIAIQYYFPGED
jgi:hypothetical protein